MDQVNMKSNRLSKSCIGNDTKKVIVSSNTEES